MLDGTVVILPSDEWQAAGVHWHAYAEARTPGAVEQRASRRSRMPDSALHSPWQVARWIDDHLRRDVQRREVFAARDGVWVTIGDENDLAHLRQENFLIASRGDSIYTDVYADHGHRDLYVEAVTDVQCDGGCTTESEPA